MKEKNRKKPHQDMEEAENLLSDVLDYYMKKGFSELIKLSKETIDGEIHLDKNSIYYYEIAIDIIDENIQLTGSIDGNGIYESDPLEIKFTIDKNNNIVG